MGLIGGRLGTGILRRWFPGANYTTPAHHNPYAHAGISKLKALFGPGIYDELRGKVVLDFGCGTGENAIELARNGCTVVGLDIQEHFLEHARRQAEAAGVTDRCSFVSTWNTPVDVILSMDAFEHFDDPEQILRSMLALLKDDAYILIEFGPTWYHPRGGHLFSVFPWAHLIFTEAALIRWRSEFKHDGATRFHEVAGGLNQMTIGRWEQLVTKCGLRPASIDLVPIRAARRLHCRLTRELLTSIVRARLVPATRSDVSQPEAVSATAGAWPR